MLKRIARTTYRKRKFVVAAWIVLLAGLGMLSSVSGGEFRSDFSLPGSESQAAIDILNDNGFETRSGAQGQIVFHAEQGVDDPAVRQAMERLFTDIEQGISGVSIVSPYAPEGTRQISADGAIAYAEVNLNAPTEELNREAAEQILANHSDVQLTGLTVEFGGEHFAEFSEPSSELIGLIAAVFILLIAFGSILAMGLPIGTALFGIGCGIMLVMISTRFIEIPDFTTAAAAMVGIGVGIDYALFIVTRYRQGLHEGRTPEDAVVTAMNTAGRAVLFAGSTVVVSVLGLLLMNLNAINGVAIGISLAVLMTMLAAVTLLPALLGFVGTRIDRFGLPHRMRPETDPSRSFWYRWSRLIQRRPLPAALAALAVLVIMAIPVADLRLGFGDMGNRPEDDTARRAYDLISEGFGPGYNGPLVLAAELPGGDADVATLDGLQERLNATPGVAFAPPAQLNADGSAAIMMVFPESSPQDAETTDLVHHLRDDVIPQTVAGSTANVKVGGATAAASDFAEYNLRQMPIFFGAVLALSFLLLMAVFRSVLVPLKAVIMNLLSIGAAYGVLVAVFQWGWGIGLLGIGREGPVEAWVPIMLFAIVFGLSMDYEVFLLSRIREEYDRTGDNATSVADGLAATARVITAAAAIMIAVFGSFVLSVDRSLQIMGFGLAVAVLVDATIVRLVLVPATMEMLGDRNWWIPGWLARVLPKVHVEAVPEPVADSALAGQPEPAATTGNGS